MIKRLRLKFIVINMGIATILLSAILGLVFYSPAPIWRPRASV